MSARIISFAGARQKLIAKRLSYTQIDLMQSIANSLPLRSQQSSTIIHKNVYDTFLTNMHTRHSEFMFPSILSGYRRGINPVDALYNNLQKSLFNYDKHDKTCVWVIGLFKDIEWSNKLCYAIVQDCNNIDNICQLYSNDIAMVAELKRIKLKFLHYLEVFKLMRTWIEH